jgi:hypothetical protein
MSSVETFKGNVTSVCDQTNTNNDDWLQPMLVTVESSKLLVGDKYE